MELGGKRFHFGFSFLLAVLATLQCYPFIGLADVFFRWNLALEICRNGKIVSDTLLSPIIPYIKAFTFLITKSFGLYTIIQSSLFYFMIGILVKLFIGEKKVEISHICINLWNLIALVLCIFPTVYVFPLLLTDSALIFILLAALIFIHTYKNLNIKIEFILVIIIVFFTVSIRINSLVLFTILMSYNLIIFLRTAMYENTTLSADIGKRNKKRLFITAAIIIGCASGVFVPYLISPVSHNASTLGMVWELTGMMKNGDKDVYMELSAYGDVDKEIERFGEPYLNSIVWDNEPPFSATTISKDYAKEITRIYIRSFIRSPVVFLRNKWIWVKGSLGIPPNILVTSQRGVHYVDNISKVYGAMDSDLQNNLRLLYFKTTDKLWFLTLSPFMCSLICFVLIVFSKILNLNIRVMIFSWGIGVCYYVSFLINTQAFEYRYYAPTFYILFLIIICSATKITIELLRRVKNAIHKHFRCSEF